MCKRSLEIKEMNTEYNPIKVLDAGYVKLHHDNSDAYFDRNAYKVLTMF